MNIPIDLGNFASCFNDASMLLHINALESSTIAEDLSWQLDTIDPSMFTSASSSLDSPTEGTFSTPESITANYAIYISTFGEKGQLHQALLDNRTPQINTQSVCLQPRLFPLIDSHQYSRSNEAQQDTTSPPCRGHPTLYPTSFPPPKRCGRPRIYPRPNDEKHTPLSTFSTSNSAYKREQNRLAAQRFRARHDAYLQDLNAQAAKLTTKNRALKMRVVSLREKMLELRYDVLKHAECGCGVVDKYIEANLGKLVGLGETGGREDGNDEQIEEKEGNEGD